MKCFKPYYKWITFNTIHEKEEVAEVLVDVLNLIINGLPSIQLLKVSINMLLLVLNLIINGLPSIRVIINITNNNKLNVLNLIINGLPSIQNHYVFYHIAY